VKAAPPITVILPAHNSEATIGAAIASTLNQSYKDFELWVLENGSSDRTAEVARAFADPRVRVFELGPVGFQGALQYAIESASSDWLARMDADDLMFTNRLATQMKILDERPDLVFVATDYALLTPFGHIFERRLDRSSCEVDRLRLGKGRFFADPSTIFNRRVALEVGGVDPDFTTGDVPLLFRMLTRGQGWEIAEPLYLYRVMPVSMSKTAQALQQGIHARVKYAPEVVHLYANTNQEGPTGWYQIAGLELLGADKRAIRQAIEVLERELPKTARRIHWLNHLGRVGPILYRLRNPWMRPFKRRVDWEQEFQPLLDYGARSQPGAEQMISRAQPSCA